MIKEIADKWVAALRSGKYPQAKKALRTANGFCCLGVLCDISGLGKWSDEIASNFDGPNQHEFLGRSNFLPEEVQKWAGMKTSDGASFVDTQGLTVLNDQLNFDFSKIADIIEKNWEQL